MTTHIYAFGSLCRGEVQHDSDIDLLAVTDDDNTIFDSRLFSIYSYKRIIDLWNDGNPFAWHLSLESALVYSSNGSNFLKDIGAPANYFKCYEDCMKFKEILDDAVSSIEKSKSTCTFDLSTIFLCMRNIATCFSLGRSNRPIFSRDSALRLGKQSIKIDHSTYKTFERARILSTRGQGYALSIDEIAGAINSLPDIVKWASLIVENSEAI